MAAVLNLVEQYRGLAGWAQAIASVVAIWWTGYSARRLQISSEQRKRRGIAHVLCEIADSVIGLTSYVQHALPNHETLFKVASGQIQFELDDVREMERILNEIPLHELTAAEFVRPTLILRSAIRQLRRGVEEAMVRPHEMDASVFEALFKTIHEANLVCFDSAKKIRGTADSI